MYIILMSYLKVKMCLVQFVVHSFQEITSIVGSKLTDLKVVQWHYSKSVIAGNFWHLFGKGLGHISDSTPTVLKSLDHISDSTPAVLKGLGCISGSTPTILTGLHHILGRTPTIVMGSHGSSQADAGPVYVIGPWLYLCTLSGWHPHWIHYAYPRRWDVSLRQQCC